MRRDGLRCLYHNSGAFGFDTGVTVEATGWVGPVDPTIRPAARPFVRPVAPPYELRLASLTGVAWRDVLAGAAWLMPKSHWAYELEFGSHAWLPGALSRIGIDPSQLAGRNNGSSIAFDM